MQARRPPPASARADVGTAPSCIPPRRWSVSVSLLRIAMAWTWLTAAAATTLTEHLDLACRQTEALVLTCDYRVLDAAQLLAATAELGGTVSPGDLAAAYPGPGDTTAVLLLIDTSDPARQAVLDRIAHQVEALVTTTAPHHRLGLATFDAELAVHLPLGSPPRELATHARTLRALGLTTELYRSVREAVRLLGASPHTRKVLVVLSDGLAEDRAYHHQDVIDAAQAAGVVIHGLGYPRSVAQAVALQTLRRLAHETGGL